MGHGARCGCSAGRNALAPVSAWNDSLYRKSSRGKDSAVSMRCAVRPDGAAGCSTREICLKQREDRERLARAYTREAALWPAALLINTDRLENAALLEEWLRRVSAPVAVDVEDGSSAERISGLRLAAPAMTAGERNIEWQRRLGPLAASLDQDTGPYCAGVCPRCERDSRDG